tara:strand:+ start:805 stop:1227 length:423 start_codon:yes stop_codon:yes gene_type:complete
MNFILSIPNIVYLFICSFFFILFAQSAIDKSRNEKENLDWLKSHFKSVINAEFVTILFYILTLLEYISAIVFFQSILNVIVWNEYFTSHPETPFLFSMLTFLCLFFGQRLAKDYEGAKTIAIYFLLNIVAIIFSVEYLGI